jgi:DNA repair photolyase
MSPASALKRPPAPLPSTPAGELAAAVDRERRRGRGTVSNASGRFEPLARVVFDDGWRRLEDLPPFTTTVTADATRKIIARNDSPDISFEQSINPYRGCEHGCVYCYARPTHAYLGLSPGLDFESKLFMKPNAPELLERELSAPGYVPKIIALGSNTDPYQPLDAKLARIMEPRAATPPRRLEALRQLAAAGVPTSTLVAPVIPAINDAELERILEAVAETGVRNAGYVLLRLPLELRDLFHEWLTENFPDRVAHVFKLVRDTRGGKDYDSTFGKRMTGSGPIAWMIGRRFEVACERLGFNLTSVKTTTEHFQPPRPASQQLDLF